MDHHVADFELVQAEEVVDELGLLDRDLSMLGGDLDQPLDLVMGEDFDVRAFANAEEARGRRAPRR